MKNLSRHSLMAAFAVLFHFVQLALSQDDAFAIRYNELPVTAIAFYDPNWRNDLLIVDSRKRLQLLSGESAEVLAEDVGDGILLEVSQEQDKVAVLSRDLAVAVFDFATRSTSRFQGAASEPVRYLRFGLDGSVIGFSETGDRYTWKTGQDISHERVAVSNLFAVSRSGDIAVANIENRVVLFDTLRQRTVVEIHYDATDVTAADLSSSNRYVALTTTLTPGVIQIHDLAKNGAVTYHNVTEDAAPLLIIDANETTIMHATSTGVFRALTLREGLTEKKFAITEGYKAISCSRSMQWIAVLTKQGSVLLNTQVRTVAHRAVRAPTYATIPVFYGTNRAPTMPLSFLSACYSFYTSLVGIVSMAIAGLCVVAFALWKGGRPAQVGFVAAILLVILLSVIHGAGIRTNLDLLRRDKFGAQVGNLTFGKCDVTVPLSHRIGAFESPPEIWVLRFDDDPESHITMQTVEPMSEGGFLSALSSHLDASKAKEAFVFIHGYNVTFEEAVRTTGQMASDLSFEGAPILFSWPSHGEVMKYPHDATNAEASAKDLREFLIKVRKQVGTARLHVIAHSMGNRVLMRALEGMNHSQPGKKVVFQQVVMAAPDIDHDLFVQDMAPTLTKHYPHVTLYASSNDRALRLSKKFHGQQRAGDTQPDITLVNGIDTIDASDIDTSLVGHSYISSTRSIVSDLFLLVHFDMLPNQRIGNKMVKSEDGVYWKMTP